MRRTDDHETAKANYKLFPHSLAVDYEKPSNRTIEITDNKITCRCEFTVVPRRCASPPTKGAG